eukprot:2597830-Alexandrium_andersonii.AAC.1
MQDCVVRSRLWDNKCAWWCMQLASKKNTRGCDEHSPAMSLRVFRISPPASVQNKKNRTTGSGGPTVHRVQHTDCNCFSNRCLTFWASERLTTWRSANRPKLMEEKSE